ncbi:MAG: hypothetical protein JNK67_11745 [Alphaproteobacteria bacterium]|nr:hypothetical protein [Alphaproteobacteria bacterium]
MTALALALGFAVLGGAFGLVAPIDGAAMSLRNAAVLALAVVLFLGCTVFGGWLAWSTLRRLRVETGRPVRRGPLNVVERKPEEAPAHDA